MQVELKSIIIYFNYLNNLFNKLLFSNFCRVVIDIRSFFQKVSEESPPTLKDSLENQGRENGGNRVETRPPYKWNDGCEGTGDRFQVNLLTSCTERIKRRAPVCANQYGA